MISLSSFFAAAIATVRSNRKSSASSLTAEESVEQRRRLGPRRAQARLVAE
jgi:hypothetical protein